MCKKAVKLGSFLQCSGHIFVGPDGCVWKINVRILWHHIMNNFQVKYGQCDATISPPSPSKKKKKKKTFVLKSLSNC